MTKQSRNARKLEARKDRRREELAGRQQAAIRDRVAARAAASAAAPPRPPFPPSLGALFTSVQLTADEQLAATALDTLLLQKK